MKKILLPFMLATLVCHAFCTNPDQITVPFELYKKLIIIQAKVNDLEGDFILDTGVSDLTLNSKYFNGLATKREFGDINGSGSKVRFRVVNLSIDDWNFDRISAEIVSFETVENLLHRPIIGNIGTTAFRKTELIIDFFSGEITLLELDENGNRRSDGPPDPDPLVLIPFTLKGDLPVLEASIGSQNLRFGLDSGAGITVIDETRINDLSGYLKPERKANLSGMDSRSGAHDVFTMTGLRVGNLECTPISVIAISLTPLNMTVSGKKIDGILGYGFFSQFRVGINFRKRTVSLWEQGIAQNR